MPAHSLEGQRVLITGLGSIGNHLVSRLQDEGASINVLTHSPRKVISLEQRGLTPFVGDITDETVMLRASEGCETIFHLAAWMGIAYKSAEAEHMNVQGTETVIHAAEKTGVSMIVDLSSTAVYGPQNGFITEETPLHPTSAYGKTKATAEDMLLKSPIDTTILRPGQMYGPHIDMWTMKIYDAIKKHQPTVIGEGRGNFNGCYIDDLVEAMVRSVTEPNARNEVYNVVGDNPPTWREVIRYYEALLDVSAVYMPAFLAIAAGKLGDLLPGKLSVNTDAIKQLTSKTVFDNTKIKNDLGIQFTPFTQGITTTIDWLKTHAK